MEDQVTVDLPARKLRVADLSRLVKDGDTWQYRNDDSSFSAKLVWLQGDVARTANNNAQITIDDDGCEATIVNCETAPGGCGWVQAGLYVMAIGVVENAGPGCCPTVSAIKLSDLSSNSTHRVTWPQEIQELKKLLNENPCIGAV